MTRTARDANPVAERGVYLSRLLGAPVLDAEGDRVARLKDLVVRFGSAPHPLVGGMVARRGRRDFFLSWSRVTSAAPGDIRLGGYEVDLRPFQRRQGEAVLRRDILDKQLIDIDGRRFIRANDLWLARSGPRLRLVGVDVSGIGLWRRLAPAAIAGPAEADVLLDWADIESFATDIPMVRLRSPHARLAKLHPVEIARIVESVSIRQGQEILESLDEETAADTVQELSPEEAADLIERLAPEQAAGILEEMEPDDAADVLAGIEDGQAEALLEQMDPEDAADVRDLLAYEGDTAAGMMTTDLAAAAADSTAGAALAMVRSMEEPPNPLYHIYLIDAEEHLAGAVSLRDIVLAPPETALADLADGAYPRIHMNDEPRQVAHTMAAYNLSDLPVVDDEGRLLGIVLVDDAMDVLFPDLWRRRLARAFRR